MGLAVLVHAFSLLLNNQSVADTAATTVAIGTLPPATGITPEEAQRATTISARLADVINARLERASSERERREIDGAVLAAAEIFARIYRETGDDVGVQSSPDSFLAFLDARGTAEIRQTVGEKARSLYDELLRTAANELVLTDPDRPAGPDANELAGPGANEPARDPEEHLPETETRNSLEAIAMYEALLADQIRTLGSGHSATIATRNSLAKAYADGGEPQKAIDAYKALLVDITEALGPDHTNTVTARVNLAYGYAAAGDLQSAIEIYEALLADPEPVVDSEEDPSLVLRDNLAYLYWQAGMPQKAVGILRTLLSEGPGPSTLNTPALLARKNSSPGCVK